MTRGVRIFTPGVHEDPTSRCLLRATGPLSLGTVGPEALYPVAAAGLLVASFVAYTRVMLYVHWTLDVAAGAALGWICVAAAERRLRG